MYVPLRVELGEQRGCEERVGELQIAVFIADVLLQVMVLRNIFTILKVTYIHITYIHLYIYTNIHRGTYTHSLVDSTIY